MSAIFRSAAVGLAAASALALAACSSSSSSNPLTPKKATSVVVGSANFPESEVLAEIYVLALQAHGIKVTAKLNIGAREITYPEMKSGGLTIMPEYNGALLYTSVNPKATATTTTGVDAALAAALPSSLGILNPSPAQDKDSVTVTAAFAKAHHLTSISQLKPLAPSMVIGAPPEFKTRAEGLLGLEHIYGLHFKSFAPLDESGPVTLKALQTGRVQAADVFTTTPYIFSSHLVVLSDPKSLFAAQNVVPLVYKKGVNSQIIAILNEISSKLTTAGLAAMDAKLYSTSHPSYQAVASAWLSSVGMAS